MVGGTVYLYMQTAGVIKLKTSPVAGFPSWSAEVTAFDPVAYGWGNVNEFAIFQHTDGNWYLLGILSATNNTVNALWSAALPADWNTGTDMGTVIDYASFPWLKTSAMAEITPSRPMADYC